MKPQSWADVILLLDHLMKWQYAFALLAAWVGWNVFAVIVVRDALGNPTAQGVLESVGVSGVSGALGTLNALVVQHYYRKAKEDPGAK